MEQPDHLHLALRSQRLIQKPESFTQWETITETRLLAPGNVALVLCDVWDEHWCRGATARLAPMLPRMEEVVTAMREAGVLIVHAPSETMTFYGRTQARLRALDTPAVQPPEPLPHDDPELPIDDLDQGCDTPPSPFFHAWTRQHPAITIDQERDVISDNGEEHFNLYQARGIKTVIIMGVHANMCILNRSFAIKALVAGASTSCWCATSRTPCIIRRDVPM